MSRRWLSIVLCCLPWAQVVAATCTVTSQPAGARVRWSRADSPTMHTAGVTPCAVDAPDGAGVVLEVTAAGYLPRFVPLAAGQTTAQIDLTRYQPELLPALTENRASRPARLVGNGAADTEQADSAVDGAGAYGLADELVVSENQSEWCHRLLWRSWQGDERTLRRWMPAPRRSRPDRDWGLRQWARTFRQARDEDPWQAAPVGSPDGRWVACVVNAEEAKPLIALCRRDGQGQREVARQTGETDLAAPTWSADGATLWYIVQTEAGNALHRLRLDSGRDQALATVTSPFLAESPDGALLACWTAAGLTLLDTAGGTQRAVAPSGTAAGPLAWSPDGQTLAGLLGDELALVPRAGGRAGLLGRVGRHVAWLPDGSGLLLDQRVIDRTGRVARSFEPPVDRPWAAYWQPDSRGLLLLGADLWPRAAVLGLDGIVHALPGRGFGAVWDGRPVRDGWVLIVTDDPTLRLQGEARAVHLWPDGRVDALSGPLSAPHDLAISVDGLSVTLQVGMADRPVPCRLAIPGGTPAPPHAAAATESPLVLLGAPGPEWQPAVASPDGRWLVTIKGDEVVLAEAAAPDEPHVLYRAGDRQYGPWIQAARPLEAGR